MTLSPHVIEKLKGNNLAMAELMKFFNRSTQTLENWMNREPIELRLTAPDTVRLISQLTGIPESEILIENNVPA